MNQLNITTLKFSPSEATTITMKSIIQTKVSKLLPEAASLSVTVKKESYGFKTDITITNVGKVHIRGEAVDEHLLSSVNGAIDDLKRRLRKFKTKNSPSNTALKSARDIATAITEDKESKEKLPEAEILREKTFVVAQMSDEEAIARMELLGHSFFIYKNDGKTCVVYKRADRYGKLICLDD